MFMINNAELDDVIPARRYCFVFMWLALDN